MADDNALVAFETHSIRRFYDESREMWYFSVVDVVAALTESTNPAVYWRVLKKRLKDEGAGETVTKCNALKMPAADGKMRLTDKGGRGSPTFCFYRGGKFNAGGAAFSMKPLTLEKS